VFPDGARCVAGRRIIVMTEHSAPPSPGPSPATRSLPQQLWATRPRRLPAQGKVAGVCAGIAWRYGIDPLLVRVAFGVATVLGGAGIPGYLACWLLLAAEGDEVSAGESLLGRGSTSLSRRKTIVLTVLLAVTGSSLVSGNIIGQGSRGLLGGLLLLGGLVLLHQRRPTPPPTPTRTPTVSLAKDSSPVTPPAWDPLGAAPFAWDLPEPAPGPLERGPRSRHTSTTLGLALLAVGVGVALRLLTGSEWLSAGRIGAIALAVVGVGLLIGAFRRQGWGLLVVVGPMVGFVLVSSLAGGVDNGRRMGNQTLAAATPDQLQASYDLGIGNVELDLRALTLVADRAVSINAGVGNVTVLLPRNLDVRVDCRSGIGNASCTVDPDGSDGRSGPVLTLTVDGGIGDVDVHRA